MTESCKRFKRSSKFTMKRSKDLRLLWEVKSTMCWEIVWLKCKRKLLSARGRTTSLKFGLTRAWKTTRYSSTNRTKSLQFTMIGSTVTTNHCHKWKMGLKDLLITGKDFSLALEMKPPSKTINVSAKMSKLTTILVGELDNLFGRIALGDLSGVSDRQRI